MSATNLSFVLSSAFCSSFDVRSSKLAEGPLGSAGLNDPPVSLRASTCLSKASSSITDVSTRNRTPRCCAVASRFLSNNTFMFTIFFRSLSIPSLTTTWRWSTALVTSSRLNGGSTPLILSSRQSSKSPSNASSVRARSPLKKVMKLIISPRVASGRPLRMSRDMLTLPRVPLPWLPLVLGVGRLPRRPAWVPGLPGRPRNDRSRYRGGRRGCARCLAFRDGPEMTGPGTKRDQVAAPNAVGCPARTSSS